MYSLMLDVRHAVRAMRRHPGFVLMTVGTLALGIGANTAIFSVVDAVLLRPLPYRDADRLVTIASRVSMPGSGTASAMSVSYPDYEEMAKLRDAIAGIAAFSSDSSGLTNIGVPRDVQVTRTTAELFPLLGVAPAIGRAFNASERRAPVAIISHALWLSDFGGDRGVLGRTVSLDGKGFTIVGVMPSGFAFPAASTQVWIPIGWALAEAPTMAATRAYRAFSTVARLAPRASLGTLRGDLDLLAKRITASGAATSKFGTGETFDATPLRDAVVGDARRPLLILLGAVALVLLIACINAANLLIARANSREKEFAVRCAMGAGRGVIARQLLVESVLLALVAAGVGLLLANVGLDLLAAQLPHGYVTGVDGRMLGFTIGLAVATGLGFGLVPAWRASAPALEGSLREGAGGTVGTLRRRARDVLVVSEVALALVLLVGSVLLVRSFVSVNAVDPGFDPQGLLLAHIRLTPARYSTPSQQRTFFEDLVQRLRHRPGVSAVTFADGPPLTNTFSVGRMNPRWVRPDDPDRNLPVARTFVGADYFSTMHIPILRGRAITADDRGAIRGPGRFEGSTPVCVVSEALAKRLWPHESPIGHTVPGGQFDVTVVGVAGDVRGESLEHAGVPAMYLPAAQSPHPDQMSELWVVARSAHPLGVVPDLRQVVRMEDPGQPIASITTYDAIVQQRYASLELITALITLFAGLALVLAVIGIAGVTAYAVSQRTRELGIRIAIGARGGDVLALLLSETVALVGIGLVIGLGAAFGVTRTLRSLLYGVTSTDLVTFGGAAVMLGLVALSATLVPAWRAARVDPVEALRSE